ncbi:MAG: hypothetical protein ACR2PV_05005 [Gammaproteobacteria bacterium]
MRNNRLKQLFSLAAFMAVALLYAIVQPLVVEAKATNLYPAPNANPIGDLTPTASDNQPWQDLSSPLYSLDFAEATILKIPQQAVNIRLPANTEGEALSTLQVRNIQVRAEWDIMDKYGAFTLRADGQKAFLMTTGGQFPAESYVITVRVKDVFSALNSAYEDLAVSAPIVILNQISATLWVLGGLTDVFFQPTRNAHFNGVGWPSRPLPSGNDFYDHSALVRDGVMYMFMGHNGSNTSNNVWRNVDGSGWENITSNGYSTRNSPRVVLFKNKFYLLGNALDTRQKNDVWRSENGADWTMLASGGTSDPTWPSTSSEYSVAATKEWMFVIGGFNTNDVWRSDDGEIWSMMPTAPDSGGSRRAYSMAVSHVIGDTEYVYVMGGLGGGNNNYLNDVWRTGDNGVTWERMTTTTIWSARVGAGIASHSGLLYVLGGDNAQGTYAHHKDVWVSIDGAEWFHVDNLPIKLTRFPAVSF